MNRERQKHLKLVERARSGDPIAFDEIVRTTDIDKKLISHIYGLGSIDRLTLKDAEDLAQEAAYGIRVAIGIHSCWNRLAIDLKNSETQLLSSRVD